jgi:hypothetical protein
MKNVINAMECVRRLDRENVMRLFHDAEQGMIAVRIAAIEAQFGIANVIALRAERQLVFHIEKGLRQPLRVFARNAQQVKRNALRRFLSNAGQPLALGNQACQRLRKFRHNMSLRWR